jgi:tellurite methyltransferase
MFYSIEPVQKSVIFALALAFSRLTAAKHAFFRSSTCKIAILQLPQFIVEFLINSNTRLLPTGNFTRIVTVKEIFLMREILAGNIARYRKEQGLTQEALGEKLGVTFQAVSKWETSQTVPDTALLPELARALNISVDKLLGYSAFSSDTSFYEDDYRKKDYFWGLTPSTMCLKVLELLPPENHIKILDIGCGEGKDAVFFARCGYDVSAFDISEAGLEKTKRLAGKANVRVRTFRANLWDYRLEENYDILYSSGVLNYIKPELRDEILSNYKTHVNDKGIAALHTFVEKPFIPRPPEKRKNEHSYPWKSGQLFTYFHDWHIEHCTEYIFDCNSGGIPHRHAANRLFARKIQSLFSPKR